MAVLEPLVTAASMLLLPVTLALALRLRPARTWLTRGRALCLALLASAGALWLEPVWTAIRYLDPESSSGVGGLMVSVALCWLILFLSAIYLSFHLRR